jgi:hypothetical protein
MNSEEEIGIKNMSDEIVREIDRTVIWTLLQDIGWTHIALTHSQDNTHTIDIGHWLEENCQGSYQQSGREFIFENEKDAIMFTLSWT